MANTPELGLGSRTMEGQKFDLDKWYKTRPTGGAAKGYLYRQRPIYDRDESGAIILGDDDKPIVIGQEDGYFDPSTGKTVWGVSIPGEDGGELTEEQLALYNQIDNTKNREVPIQNNSSQSQVPTITPGLLPWTPVGGQQYTISGGMVEPIIQDNVDQYGRRVLYLPEYGWVLDNRKPLA